jgi:YVTN family beta-propeller protein
MCYITRVPRKALLLNAMKKLALVLLIAVAAVGCASQTTTTSQPDETSQTEGTSALQQVQAIALANVEGRIDHMALDAQSGRLFVAALGNNTLEVIDLNAGTVTDEITGLREPQGVAYVPEDNKLLVTNGDGDTLDIYDGQSLKLLTQVVLGDDPDNVRYDAATGYAYVGYGTGTGSALGVVDVRTGTKVADIELSGHPESFQLEDSGQRIFVNVPTAGHIAVVDRDKGSVVETWSLSNAAENFPMALDDGNHRLFVGTRSPAKLPIFDTETGKMITSLDSSRDADDIFYDATNKRIYVSGGEGAISVFEQTDPDNYSLLDKVDTAEGARTSLFVPESGTLYVAVPHRGSQQAEVRAFQTKSEGSP